MTTLIKTPWHPSAERSSWHDTIRARAAVLDPSERHDFHRWTAMIAGLDDAALIKLIRRPRRSADPARDAHAVEVLMAQRERTLDAAQAFIEEQAMADAPRAAMLAMVEQTRALAAVCPCLPVFDFPAGVSERLQGSPAHALDASRVLCLYYMGISLFDDVIDHDLDGEWAEFTPEQVSCAALALVSALPILALPESRLGDAGSWARAIELLGRASAEMSEGQFLDIGGLRIDDTSLDACERIVELKTGSTGALAAALSAATLGAKSELESSLARTGFNLYCAMQVISDIQDVWSKPISRDLANGVTTPPISWFLETAGAGPRAEFLALFRAGSERFDEHQRMRSLLEAGGALRYAVCRAELYRRQAAASLGRGGESPLFAYMLDAACLGELPA
ncbi:MAG: polyprenyl synthetase family protein [Enhygromyxa sp.]